MDLSTRSQSIDNQVSGDDPLLAASSSIPIASEPIASNDNNDSTPGTIVYRHHRRKPLNVRRIVSLPDYYEPDDPGDDDNDDPKFNPKRSRLLLRPDDGKHVDDNQNKPSALSSNGEGEGSDNKIPATSDTIINNNTSVNNCSNDTTSSAAAAIAAVAADSAALALMMCLNNYANQRNGSSNGAAAVNLFQSQLLPTLAAINARSQPPPPQQPGGDGQNLLSHMIASAEKIKQQIKQRSEEFSFLSGFNIARSSSTISEEKHIEINSSPSSSASPMPTINNSAGSPSVSSSKANTTREMLISALKNRSETGSPSSKLLQQTSLSSSPLPPAKSFGKTFLYNTVSDQEPSGGQQVVPPQNQASSNTTGSAACSPSSSSTTSSSIDGLSVSQLAVKRTLSLPASVAPIENQQHAFAIANRFRTGPLRLWMVAGDTLQLWQFLLQLLLDTPLYSNPETSNTAIDNSGTTLVPPICWTGQGWEFKIADSEVVARLWGMYKNCPRMNYAKLARGLRFYYGKSIVEKTPIAFVYRFFNDKVTAQAIDGCRMKQCYDFTKTRASGRVAGDKIAAVAGELDRRTTLGELLRKCSQVVMTPGGEGGGAGQEGPVDLTSTADLRPTKVLQSLAVTLMTPETAPNNNNNEQQ